MNKLKYNFNDFKARLTVINEYVDAAQRAA